MREYTNRKFVGSNVIVCMSENDKKEPDLQKRRVDDGNRTGDPRAQHGELCHLRHGVSRFVRQSNVHDIAHPLR